MPRQKALTLEPAPDHDRTSPPETPSSPDGKILGVFSSTQIMTIGAGQTKKKISQNVLFYVQEDEGEHVLLRPLNPNFIPSDSTDRISKETLLKNFLPEPAVYQNKVVPAMRELNKTVARGERFLRNNELFSAENEFKNALRIDEDNVRATFGLGKTYLAMGDKERGDLVFQRIVRLEAAFEPKHKHLFNEFGISLRKLGKHVQALKYYARAYKYSQDDEHLAFNMARALYEKGSPSLAMKFVLKALKNNPEFQEAEKFRAFLEDKTKASTSN